MAEMIDEYGGNESEDQNDAENYSSPVGNEDEDCSGRVKEECVMIKAEDGSLSCNLCNKMLATKWSFYRHLKRQHGVDTMGMQYKKIHYDCVHEECRKIQVSFGTIVGYRQHLEKVHNVAGITVPTELEFDSFDDVRTWLAMQERKDMAKFVKWSGVSHAKDSKTWRYYCNRSGTYKSHGSGQRQLKSQGSCKTGHRCPAAVVVVNKGNKFYVMYHSIHYGHEKMLGHLSLAPSIRQHIAGQLAAGMSPDKILKDIRLSVDSDFDRNHLITRKDVHNIRRAYGIDRVSAGGTSGSGSDTRVGGGENKGDASLSGPGASLGVCAWVEEIEELGEDSPVILFKQSTTTDTTELSLDGLKKDCDFVLGLMNPLQRKMLAKFGRDRVCIDTTYGQAGYDFHLTTLLVVDDYDEGFPVAYFCCSNLTAENFKEFLESVKSAVEVEIKPSTLICDEVQIVYNTWASVMGAISKRLLYTQHVDRSCRGKNASNITLDRDKRQAVQKSLRACHIELRNVKQELMCLGNEGRRVDKCIDALFSFLLEKQFDRLSKLHKGKLSSKVANLLQGHTEGATLASSCISLGNSQWQVASTSVLSRSYFVQKTNPSHACSDSCAVVCKQCSACLDNMSCTCDVYQIVGMMCKHIHAVCISETVPISNVMCESGSLVVQQAADEMISQEAQSEIQFYMSTLRGTKCAPSRVQAAQTLVQEIQTLLNEQDVDATALAGVMQNLKAAKGLLIMNRESKSSNVTLTTRGRVTGKAEKRTAAKSQLQQQMGGVTEYEDLIAGNKRVKIEDPTGQVIALIETGNGMQEERELDRCFVTSLMQACDVQTSLMHAESLVSLLEAVTLSREEQQAVLVGEELNERHVTYALSLLRKQFPSIGGLEAPLAYHTLQGFTSTTDTSSISVQVHYAGGPVMENSGHQWVTSCRCVGDNCVVIYDPQMCLYDAESRPQMSSSLQLQVAQLYRCVERELRVLYPEISWSVAPADTALYAIASAVDICYGNPPMQRSYDVSKLRPHLVRCFEAQKFEPFPGTFIAQPSTSYYLSIPVYCYCRRPGDDGMVECVQCFESFHGQCVQYTGGDFKCSACCSNNQLEYIITASQLQG